MQQAPDTWAGLFATARHLYHEDYDDTVRSVQPRTTLMGSPTGNIGRDGQGLRRFKAFELILATAFKWKPQKFARDFHALCSAAFAVQLLADDWQVYGPLLMEAKQWEYRSRWVTGCTARRGGKSVSLAQVFATLIYIMLTMPGMKHKRYPILCIALVKRATVMLCDYVTTFLRELGIWDDYMYMSNTERLGLRNDDTGYDTTILFAPKGSTK